MKRALFGVLLFLAAYVPLEDFVLKWLPVSEVTYAALRQLPEVIVWLLALVATLVHLAQHGTIRFLGRGMDWCLVGFLAVAVGTVFINGGDPFPAFVNLKALVRHIPLVYTLAVLEPTEEEARRFYRVVGTFVGFQIAAGLAVWLGGAPVRVFFAVRSITEGVGGVELHFTSLREVSSVAGTMGHTISYAFFLLVGLTLWLTRTLDRPVRYWGGAAGFLFMLSLTNSRISVFVGALVVVLHQLLAVGPVRAVRLGLLAVPAAVAGVLILGEQLVEGSTVLDVFSSSYLQNAMLQRLGIVVYLLPQALFGGPHALFGYSGDPAIVLAAFFAQFRDVPLLLLVVLVDILEDVYWVALFFYYGALGLGLFVAFLVKAGRTVARVREGARSLLTHDLAMIAQILLLVAVPLNMLNQAFEVRSFSFYVWMFLGLALARGRAEAASARPPATLQA